MGEKHMLRRQTMIAMSGVFSECVHGGGMSDAMKETMIARMIAVSFGILWAVVIGLMLNGS
jgi:Mg2+/citrate symporter